MKIWCTEYIEDNRTFEPRRYKDYCVEGETETECFEKIYTKYVRPLRYCSGRYILLSDTDADRRFKEWRKHGVTIQMFYGNGTVD